MNYKRITLMTLSIGGCMLAAFFGYKLYTIVSQKRNILGATVIRIDKNNVISSKDQELVYYYEPVPNKTENIIEPHSGTKSTATINSDGIVSPHEYRVNKPQGTYRIVAIGDSFTFGLFVNTVNSWPYLLENDLNNRLICNGYDKFEVINLGESGYDYQYALHRYITRGYKYKPDVIIFFDSGMMQDRMRELTSPYENQCTKEYIAKNPGATVSGNIGANCCEKAWNVVLQKYSAQQLLDLRKASWDNFFGFQDKSALIYMTYANVRGTNKAAAEYFLSGRPNVYLDDTVKGFYDPDLTFSDGHPNVLGHQVIEQNIFDYLKNNFLKSCTYATQSAHPANLTE